MFPGFHSGSGGKRLAAGGDGGQFCSVCLSGIRECPCSAVRSFRLV